MLAQFIQELKKTGNLEKAKNLSWFFKTGKGEYGEGEAELWLKKLERYSLQVSRKILIEAVKFRHEHKKQNISFFDAVGYIFSTKNGYHFVTGDKEFKGREGVLFIQK